MFDIGAVRLTDLLITPSGSCESLPLVSGGSAPNVHDISSFDPEELPTKSPVHHVRVYMPTFVMEKE